MRSGIGYLRLLANTWESFWPMGDSLCSSSDRRLTSASLFPVNSGGGHSLCVEKCRTAREPIDGVAGMQNRGKEGRFLWTQDERGYSAWLPFVVGRTRLNSKKNHF